MLRRCCVMFTLLQSNSIAIWFCVSHTVSPSTLTDRSRPLAEVVRHHLRLNNRGLVHDATFLSAATGE